MVCRFGRKVVPVVYPRAPSTKGRRRIGGESGLGEHVVLSGREISDFEKPSSRSNKNSSMSFKPKMTAIKSSPFFSYLGFQWERTRPEGPPSSSTSYGTTSSAFLHPNKARPAVRSSVIAAPTRALRLLRDQTRAVPRSDEVLRRGPYAGLCRPTADHGSQIAPNTWRSRLPPTTLTQTEYVFWGRKCQGGQ